jgi:hypothetical protein
VGSSGWCVGCTMHTVLPPGGAIRPPNMIETVSEGIIVCPTDEVKTKAIGVQ